MAEKDERMNKMSRMQDHVDAEVQELTEKLFQAGDRKVIDRRRLQEAYKMVHAAEEKREKSEKRLTEKELEVSDERDETRWLKVEVLLAEVQALKELIQTPGMGLQHFRHTSPEHKSTLAKLFSSNCMLERWIVHMILIAANSSKKQQRDASATRKSSTLPTTSQEKKEQDERENERREADAVEEVENTTYNM